MNVPANTTAPATIETRSGLIIAVRPATEADEAALTGLFEQISAEDRRFRFFSAAAHIGHEQLRPLIDADHFRSESFLAFDSATDELIGTGLLACDNAMDTAEVAISVRGDRKGLGVGWALLDFLTRDAARRGVARVISIESRDNHTAVAVEREKGFVASAMTGDPGLVVLTRTFR
jgi:acetyltransferase